MTTRRRVFSRPFYWWIGFLVVLVLFGLYGATRSLPPGLRTETFGTYPPVEWGFLVPTYVFFVVITSGLCLVSSLGHVFGIERYKPIAKRAVMLAFVTLIIGLGCIGLDLGQNPVRVVGFVLSPNLSSPMWWMGILYSAYLVFLAIELWGLLAERMKVARTAGTLTFVTALSALSTLGFLFGALVARPYWHGPYLPIYFILAALVSAAALLGIVFFLVGALKGGDSGFQTKNLMLDIGTLLALFLGIDIFFTVWQTISGLYGRVPGQYEATMALIAGPLSAQFWTLKVFIGLLLPFLLLVVPRTRTVAGVFAASILTFIGMFVDRIELVETGQIIPPSVVSGVVSFPYAHFTPSLVEISIAVGATGFALLAYSFAERYVNMGQLTRLHN